MTTNPDCFVDPALPRVLDTDVRCCHCGQSLETILEGGPALPPRHFIRPTQIRGKAGGPHIRTDGSGTQNPNICPMTRDDLTTLIYLVQRAMAKLNPPRLYRQTSGVA